LASLFKDFTSKCDSRQNNLICREHTLKVLFDSSVIPLIYTTCELVCWSFPEFKHIKKKKERRVGWGKKRK
jgi:hypothetical protein